MTEQFNPNKIYKIQILEIASCLPAAIDWRIHVDKEGAALPNIDILLKGPPPVSRFMKITFGVDKDGGKTPQVFSRTGKILFTHFGVSGPLILNAAHEVKKLLDAGPVHALIDLYPDTEIGTLRNRVLEVFDQHKNKALKNVLKEFVPAGMSEAVAAQLTDELREEKVHSITKEERHDIVDRLKAMPLTVTGTMGMDWAVISDGGVDLTEVDTKTMCSKRHNNLYII